MLENINCAFRYFFKISDALSNILGYCMLIEVKSNKRHGSYQKAKKQLFCGKASLEKIFSAIGTTTQWLYVGVFFALVDDDKCSFECENCSNFVIVGEEQIFEKIKIVEEKVSQKSQDWKPEEHVEEFIKLAKETLFIAQGDPYAPVTGSNIIARTVGYGNTGCGVFNGRIKILKGLWLKINCSQMELSNLENWSNGKL